MRFLTTLGQFLLFSLHRYHTYLIVTIVWSTGYWTSFPIFWTDLNFCKCLWNVINFCIAKDDAVVSTFKQIGRLSVVRKRFRAITTRLNFFRLRFFLKWLEWVLLPMTTTHLWNWPKNAKNNSLKSQRILKPKYKPSGALLLRLACQEGEICPTHRLQLRHKQFKYWLNKSNRLLRCLLQLINTNASNLFSQTISLRLELSSSNVEKSCVSYFKIADNFFKQTAGYDFSAARRPLDRLQGSIALYSFIWNETNSDTNIAAHLSDGQ